MIDYAKYENADRSTILSAFNATLKRQKKPISKPKKEQFYTLEDSPAIKAIDDWASQHPEELAEVKAQLAKEMGY